MGILSTLRVKLTADIGEYAEAMRAAQQHAVTTKQQLLGVSSGLGSMGSALGSMASVAAGMLIATGVTAIGRAIEQAGRDALGAVASYERLELSLTTMTAREIQAAAAKRTSIFVGTQKIGLTEKEALAQSDLTIKMIDYRTSIALAEEKLAKYIKTGKHSKLEIQDQQNKLEAMRRKYGEMTAELTKLDAKEHSSTALYKTLTTNTMTMAQAQEAATGRVKELLGWIQKLAIESPFTREEVAQGFRLALAYGFTTKEAQQLTQATLDFSSATGQTGDVVGRLMLALGQIRGKGKVMGQELRQLSEAGAPVNEILATMGFTLEDVSNGLVKSDDFIAAYIKSVETSFGGAAKAQSKTFSGLISSMTDLKDVALRTVFTPLFAALKPILDGLVTALQSPEVLSAFNRMGEAISKPLVALKTFRTLIEQGIEPMSAFRTVLSGALGPDALKTFDEIVSAVQRVVDWIKINGPTISTVLGAIAAIGATLAGIFVAGQLYGVLVAIGGTLAAIGTPILILIGVAALLGAIWSSNWMGIRTALEEAWVKIQPTLQMLGDWLAVNIPIAIAAVTLFWETQLRPALESLGTWIATVLIPAIADFVVWLGVNIPIAIEDVSRFWNTVLLPALTDFWNWVTGYLIPGIDQLAARLDKDLRDASEGIAKMWNTQILPALKAVEKFITVDLLRAWNGLKDIIGIINPQLKTFIDDPLKKLNEGFEWLKKLIEEVAKLWVGLTEAFTKMKLPDFLVRRSPSPLEQAFMGVRDTLKDIHFMGMPDWGSFNPPAYATPSSADEKGGGGGSREVRIESINIGSLANGLDAYEIARSIGREVSRRL